MPSKFATEAFATHANSFYSSSAESLEEKTTHFRRKTKETVKTSIPYFQSKPKVKFPSIHSVLPVLSPSLCNFTMCRFAAKPFPHHSHRIKKNPLLPSLEPLTSHRLQLQLSVKEHRTHSLVIPTRQPRRTAFCSFLASVISPLILP